MSERGRDLYYMAPMTNVRSIVARGILSHNQVPEQGLKATSFADLGVNHRREKKSVPECGRSLHDFVPLYWATHTPMQYVITMKPKGPKGIAQDDLVFIVMNAQDILEMDGVMTTNGNAADDNAQFYAGGGAIPKLDWDVIKTSNCFSKTWKFLKAAEVLVPDCIPPGKIRYYAVRSDQAKSKLENAMANGTLAGTELKCAERSVVRVCPRYYYQETTRRR